MRIADLNWMQVESLATREDRAVLPIGSTEQHAYLSLATDDILAERVAVEAAEPLGVPVFPVLAYGLTPSFTAFPGTVTLSEATFSAALGEILDGILGSGFRRVLVVNGHGGNSAAAAARIERWRAAHPGTEVVLHDWWRAPRVMGTVRAIDPEASHASWMEAFPWTRLPGVEPPSGSKPLIAWEGLRGLDAQAVRERIGDGSYGGCYLRSDDDMRRMWHEAVRETRALIEHGWAGEPGAR